MPHFIIRRPSRVKYLLVIAFDHFEGAERVFILAEGADLWSAEVAARAYVLARASF